ncbi:hypothetical protein HMPREF0972_00105 [Actinomyces sp. oral taxon 848 str. F0332]|nr:hypothetical protein HMPREF0972_00105 [Actinomyces sp. oral taxon 848 str. F0332]
MFALPFEPLLEPFAPLFDPTFGPSAYGLTDVADVAIVSACAGIAPKARLTPINPANEAVASRADLDLAAENGRCRTVLSGLPARGHELVEFVVSLMAPVWQEPATREHTATRPRRQSQRPEVPGGDIPTRHFGPRKPCGKVFGLKP